MNYSQFSLDKLPADSIIKIHQLKIMFNNKVQAIKSKLPPGSAMAIKKNIPSASSNMSTSQRLRTGFNKARGTGSSATYKSLGSI